MTCSDIEPLLSQHLDGVCTAQEEARVREHVRICPACAQLQQELAHTKALLGALPERAAPRTLAPAVSARLRAAAARPEPFWRHLTAWFAPPIAWRTATAVSLAAVVVLAFLAFSGLLTPNGGDQPSRAVTAAQAATLSEYVDSANAVHRAYVNQVQPFETSTLAAAPLASP